MPSSGEYLDHRRVDDNWAEGALGDKVGIFPLLYVEFPKPSECGSSPPPGAAECRQGQRSPGLCRRHEGDIAAGERSLDSVVGTSPNWGTNAEEVRVVICGGLLGAAWHSGTGHLRRPSTVLVLATMAADDNRGPGRPLNDSAKQLIEMDKLCPVAVSACDVALPLDPGAVASVAPAPTLSSSGAVSAFQRRADGKKNTKKRHSFTSLSWEASVCQCTGQGQCWPREVTAAASPVTVQAPGPDFLGRQEQSFGEVAVTCPVRFWPVLVLEMPGQVGRVSTMEEQELQAARAARPARAAFPSQAAQCHACARRGHRAGVKRTVRLRSDTTDSSVGGPAPTAMPRAAAVAGEQGTSPKVQLPLNVSPGGQLRQDGPSSVLLSCPQRSSPVFYTSDQDFHDCSFLVCKYSLKEKEKSVSPRLSCGRARGPPSRYLALYAYKPQKSDELELRKGEMYRVLEKCQDGWFKGASLRTGVSGVFPGNYVTPVSRAPVGGAGPSRSNAVGGSPLAKGMATTMHPGGGSLSSPATATRPALPITTPQAHAQHPTASPPAGSCLRHPAQPAASQARSSTPAAAHPSTPAQDRPTATVSPLRTQNSPSRLPAASLRPHSTVSPQQAHQPPLQACTRPAIPLSSAASAITPPNVSAANLGGEAGGGPAGSLPTSSPTSTGCKPDEKKNEKLEATCSLAHQQAQASGRGRALGSSQEKALPWPEEPEPGAGEQGKVPPRAANENPELSRKAGGDAAVQHQQAKRAPLRAVQRGQEPGLTAQWGGGLRPPSVATLPLIDRVCWQPEGAPGAGVFLMGRKPAADPALYCRRQCWRRARRQRDQAPPQPRGRSSLLPCARGCHSLASQLCQGSKSRTQTPAGCTSVCPFSSLTSVPGAGPRLLLCNGDEVCIVGPGLSREWWDTRAQLETLASGPGTPAASPTAIVPWKEKKSGLLKLLAGASARKKSRSPPSVSPTHDPQVATDALLQGAVGPEICSLSIHGRAGSCPIESELQGAVGLEPLHRKAGSLDLNFSLSPSRQAPLSMAAIRPEPKPLPRERYRVVVSYPPQSEAEIELKEGDIVFVHKKREDGWYKGTLQRTGRTGLFPGSFVESF
ncbi:SH3 domain-containing RING finger protein 3 [Tupaia chinensis]|uniref:RING-type E3 ubiquitin transferase n=1 Tax=Tupaia chinensis TaxID=246437 RepID=L9LB81_TUPCH|nr:SH3 domain-containing RING finger protein 3 [Tupaia chinensis]